jgi:hypothetical protein
MKSRRSRTNISNQVMEMASLKIREVMTKDREPQAFLEIPPLTGQEHHRDRHRDLQILIVFHLIRLQSDLVSCPTLW